MFHCPVLGHQKGMFESMAVQNSIVPNCLFFRGWVKKVFSCIAKGGEDEDFWMEFGFFLW